jgi:K+-transporting ATPase ATPase C chain
MYLTRQNLQAYLALEQPYDQGLRADQVPVDAATFSASGVDPHISKANAAIQAHRIAAVRRLAPARVAQLIADSTDGRGLGIFGEPGVNVTKLNLALDQEAR